MQQTGQTNKHGPRPLPTDTEYAQLVNQSFIPFQLAFRPANLGVGECEAAAHMRWWVVLHFGRSSFASLVGLTMPLLGAQGLGLFDNAILRGAAPFKRTLTYSRTAGSSVLAIWRTLYSVLELDKRVSEI